MSNELARTYAADPRNGTMTAASLDDGAGYLSTAELKAIVGGKSDGTGGIAATTGSNGQGTVWDAIHYAAYRMFWY